MNHRTVCCPDETCSTVLDPTLGRWRRRYFHQPASGRGHRAFTAKRAARGPGALGRLWAWWQQACDRETARRQGWLRTSATPVRRRYRPWAADSALVGPGDVQ